MFRNSSGPLLKETSAGVRIYKAKGPGGVEHTFKTTDGTVIFTFAGALPASDDAAIRMFESMR
ncbi:MAG: hypothetical protein U0547_02205 [Dehalococcoidia bacterium]